MRRQTDQSNGPDIKPISVSDLKWDPENIPGSLDAFRMVAVEECRKVANWYWREKKVPGILSRYFRASIIVSPAVSAVLAAGTQVYNNGHAAPSRIDTTPVIGVIAAIGPVLLGLDKALGFTTSWIRYIVTATAINREITSFETDWFELMAKSSSPMVQSEYLALIARAKQLLNTVQALLAQETGTWAKEFSDSLLQLDKSFSDHLTDPTGQAPKGKDVSSSATPSG